MTVQLITAAVKYIRGCISLGALPQSSTEYCRITWTLGTISTAVMPESTQEYPDISYDSYRNKGNLLGHYTQSTNFYSPISDFCTEDNIPECIFYLNQEAASLGFPSVQPDPVGGDGLDVDVVSLLNSMYALLERHHRVLRALDQLEAERLRSASDMQRQQLSQGRLKDQLELIERENARLQERERQLQLNIKSLKKCLKNEKEEVQKLQNIRASRSMQYNHDMRKKEREYYKLKEHLNQLLIDKKDSKQAIEVLNCVSRADGRRGQWKTRKTEARHEEEMYQTLLKDFDNRQRELMLENVELRKVLQQIKKEMISILSPKQSSWREVRQEHCEKQELGSDEEVVCDAGRDSLEQSCEQAKEELTNSIRQQWRKLKHHVEKLDNQASLVHVQQDSEVMAKEAHDKEMEQLRQEIQQCKDFIHTQQQLLQQLSSPCDEETASLLKDCYMLEEKERLKEEWNVFEEQRKNFASERQNFTEAAIRLGRERKLFEEDRATWLKHQFLNLSFADHVNPPLSKSTGVLSEYVETSPAPSSLSDVFSQMVFSPPEVSSVRPSSSAEYQQTHLPQSRF